MGELWKDAGPKLWARRVLGCSKRWEALEAHYGPGQDVLQGSTSHVSYMALVLSLFFPHFEGPDAPSMLCPHLCASVFKATLLSPGGSSQVPCHCGVWSSSPTTTLSLSEHSFLPWTGPSRLRTLPQCGCCPWRLSELLWYLRHLIPGPLSMLLLCGHKNTSLPAPKVLGRHWCGVGTVGEPDLVKSSIKGLWAEGGSWERRSGL